MKTRLCIWLGLLLWINFSGVIIASTKEREMMDMTECARYARDMKWSGDSFTLTLYPIEEYALGFIICKNEEIEEFCHIHHISPERRLWMKEGENSIQIDDEIIEINGLSVRWNSQCSVLRFIANELTQKGFVTMTFRHMKEILDEEGEDE